MHPTVTLVVLSVASAACAMLFSHPHMLHLSPHDIKVELRETEQKIKHKTKQALNATPTVVAVLLIFPLTIGIMMTWVVPIFLVGSIQCHQPLLVKQRCMQVHLGPRSAQCSLTTKLHT